MVFRTPNARARAWGLTAPDPWQASLGREAEVSGARLREREAQRNAKLRVPCGARTRKGLPCRLKSEPGRRRCKFHGGKSTGPRTAEGRAKIAEAQRQRWAAWQQAETPEEVDKQLDSNIVQDAIRSVSCPYRKVYDAPPAECRDACDCLERDCASRGATVGSS
nr:HGGxSTG domain-containing protein [Rubellimicrobium arenae]